MKSLNLVPDDDPSVSETLQLICGVVDVNSFELRPPGHLEGLYLRGLFAEGSLLAHNCVGNLHLTVDSNFKLIIHASVPIKEGDAICFNYSSSVMVCLFAYYKIFTKLYKILCVGILKLISKCYTICINVILLLTIIKNSEVVVQLYNFLLMILFIFYIFHYQGTLSRRSHLRKTKYFDCDCSMCRDPYELGSYKSSVLCPRCKEGYVGLENPLSNLPYEKETKWKCNNCEHHIGGCLVKTTLELCKSLMNEVDPEDAKVRI